MMTPPKQSEKSKIEPATEKQEIDVVNPKPTVHSVLLVAPHAWNKTEGKEKGKDYTDKDYDVRTGEIAKKVAEKIGCKALINWDWKKETKPARNYNNKPDAEDDKTFISHLEAAGSQETLVLWIHGAKTAEITKEETQYNKDNKKSIKLDAVLGYGQGGNLSAKQDKADSFIKNLCRQGLQTVSASKARKKFCANEPDNMCQWFNQQKDEKGKPKYPNVQSLQLEIKYAGFRNNDAEADKTAGIIEKALREHLGINPPVPATQDDNAVEAKPEEKVDEELVEQAFQKISEIFGKHYYNAMEEVGNYLIETFYGGDFKRAEERRALKEQSFLQLVSKIQGNSDNKPSKTWLYNARDLAVDIYNFKDGIPAYMKLGHSHRVILTNVRDKGIKVKFIEEAYANNYTVARLRERINEEKEPIRLSISLKNLPPVKELRKIRLKRLQNFEKKAEEEIKGLNKTIKDYQKKIERLKKVIGEKQGGKDK
jgi:hypothetical protein